MKEKEPQPQPVYPVLGAAVIFAVLAIGLMAVFFLMVM